MGNYRYTNHRFKTDNNGKTPAPAKVTDLKDVGNVMMFRIRVLLIKNSNMAKVNNNDSNNTGSKKETS